MKENYDCVVAGAGPAGSTFARIAAEKGLSVLLLEKRNEIGVPKRCGEGLSKNSLAKGDIKPDKEWIRQEIKGTYMYSPSGKRLGVDYKKTVGYAIDRKVFDKWLAFKAADAGAEVYSGARVTSLIKDGNKTKGVNVKHLDETSAINSSIVIAADGVESKVARWAGINSTNKLSDICSGVQFEMGNLELENPHMLEFYLGNEIAPGGYVWVFPKGKNTANVGIGIRANKGGRAIDYLKKFIDARPNLKKGSIIEVNGGGVPVGEPLEQLVSDGLMIVGDAAHQVNAIHGGGIGEAMLSARIAAKAAKKAAEQNDFSKAMLQEYEKEWSSTEGNRLKKIVRLREIVESLTDEELDFLAGELTGENIIQLTKANKFKILTKVFAKNPKLIRFMPKLLSAR